MLDRLRNGAGFEARPPATTVMPPGRRASRDKNHRQVGFFLWPFPAIRR
jgi:hypothetical protein